MMPLNLTAFTPLPQSQRRLLELFYREHGSPMRPSGTGQPWVARANTLVAGLSLTPVAQGHWLTGLFVAPNWRGRGVAKGLVAAALSRTHGTAWLFCDPELRAFYERLGFAEAVQLPAELDSRLQRYRRTKALIALARPQ